MPKPVLHGRNFADGATLVVSGEAVTRPKYRLNDRDIGQLFQDTSNAGTREYRAYRPGGPAVGSWAFPAGHNLVGSQVDLYSSPDGTTTVFRDSFGAGNFPAGTAHALRTLSSPVTADYWHVFVQGAAAAPAFAELYLSTPVILPFMPSDRQPFDDGQRGNVTVHGSTAGYEWMFEHGPSRWFSRFILPHVTAATVTALRALYVDLKSGANPFFLQDYDGVVRWVRWVNPDMTFRTIDAVPARYHVPFDLLEVL